MSQATQKEKKCAHDLITNFIGMAVDEFLFLGFRGCLRGWRSKAQNWQMATTPVESNKFYDFEMLARKRHSSWEIAHKRDVSEV